MLDEAPRPITREYQDFTPFLQMCIRGRTKTAGKTATSKSVANAKAGKAVRTLSLQQQLIKAERDLKNIDKYSVTKNIHCLLYTSRNRF